MNQEDLVRQLKRFKNDIENNSFHNANYQLAVLTEASLENYQKQIALPIEELLEILAIHTSEELIE